MREGASGSPSGAVLRFNQGCTIGCPKCLGVDGDSCSSDQGQETLPFEARTYNLDNQTCGINPWCAPGSSPIMDPCGISGGDVKHGAAGLVVMHLLATSLESRELRCEMGRWREDITARGLLDKLLKFLGQLLPTMEVATSIVSAPRAHHRQKHASSKLRCLSSARSSTSSTVLCQLWETTVKMPHPQIQLLMVSTGRPNSLHRI